MIFRSLMTSVCCLVLVLAVAGCSQEERLELPDAKLIGKVTYKGKPVPYALIIVLGKSSTPATANADDSGNYTIEHVEVGEVKVGVNTDAGRGHMMSATMAAAQTKDKSLKPTFVDIPKKYFDPNTSGITLNLSVAKGDNNQDIVIE